MFLFLCLYLLIVYEHKQTSTAKNVTTRVGQNAFAVKEKQVEGKIPNKIILNMFSIKLSGAVE